MKVIRIVKKLELLFMGSSTVCAALLCGMCFGLSFDPEQDSMICCIFGCMFGACSFVGYSVLNSIKNEEA